MSSQRSAFPLAQSLDAPEQDARTVDMFSDEGSRVLEVLGSETARSILTALSDEPATTSELADHTDTSVQNAHYHLDRLAAASLVEVCGTHYSSRGAEMDVYAPAHEPLCLVAGDGEARRATGQLESETSAFGVTE